MLAAIFAAAGLPSTGTGATARVVGETLRYKAASGEANEVVMTPTLSGVSVHDSGAAITARVGCVQINANEVECSGVTGTFATFGDQGDKATMFIDGAVFGEAGADEITGCFVCNLYVSGGPDADVIVGNGDFEGDGGNDTITALRTGTIDGGPGDDVLTGGRSNDRIEGRRGNDRLDGGGGGRDRLSPGGGDDFVDGGPGNKDWVVFEEFGPAVVANLRTGEASGQGADTLVGLENMSGTFDGDRLTGDEKDNNLTGVGGPDTVVGGGGNDRLRGGTYSRTGARLLGGRGNDSLVSGRRDDVLRGGRGDDFMLARRGRDLLIGGAGKDTLLGAGGNDRFRARDGKRDVLDGGDGIDQAQVDVRLDAVRQIESIF